MPSNRNEHIDTEYKFDRVTLAVKGETGHSRSEVNDFAEIASHVFKEVGLRGLIKVKLHKQRLSGSHRLKGLSAEGVSHGKITLGYQPNGNDSRHAYQILSLGDNGPNTLKVYGDIKNFLGEMHPDDRLKLAKSKPAPAKPKPAPPVAAEKPVPQPKKSGQKKPMEEPKVQYWKDSIWIEAAMLELAILAEEHDDILDKFVVTAHLLDRTHYTSLQHMGYLVRSLREQGYLIPQPGFSDTKGSFKIILDPDASSDESESKAEKVETSQPKSRINLPAAAKGLVRDSEAAKFIQHFAMKLSQQDAYAVARRMFGENMHGATINRILAYLESKDFIKFYKSSETYGAGKSGRVLLQNLNMKFIKFSKTSESRSESEAAPMQTEEPVVPQESVEVSDGMPVGQMLNLAIEKAEKWKREAEELKGQLADSESTNDVLRGRIEALNTRIAELELLTGGKSLRDMQSRLKDL